MLRVGKPIFGHAFEPNQVVNGAFENKGAVGLMNFESGGDLPSPGGEGTVTDLQVLDLNKLPLFPFQPLPERIAQRLDLVLVPVLVSTSELGQGQDQQNQNALQHNLSFGTHTLPPDRDLVNNSEAISYQPSALSFDQLALLNQATITIADLADGYLALTLGTTIKLDTDAAGYGWFVDQTPFLNEEFVSGASSLVKREASEANDEIRATNNASPWQFFAKPDSAAAGKIDLMTLLSYEHGHK